jgi:Flp pilus assembly protein TadD
MQRRIHTLIVLIALAATVVFGEDSDYDRGVALLDKAQYAAALPYLGRAAQSQPGDARVWKALGVAFAARKQYDLAEPAFARACRLDSKLQDACYYHGRTLYALDRFDASLHVLERAAQVEPGSWKIHLGIAEALEALGQAAAENAFNKAIDLAKGADPEPAVAYAQFLVRQGRTPDALPVLERAVRRFPDSSSARIQLGRALLEQGSVEAAISHLERAISLAPDSAQAHLLLAKAYTRAGRTAEARIHYEAAARFEPSSRR